MPPKKKTTQRQWRRMDLHLHTPASADYKSPEISYLDFLKKAEEKNLDILAFTDHNTVSGYARFLEEVESLEMLERLKRLRDDERKRLAEFRRLCDKILILPGFEFTATLGFHILGIFPPDTTVRQLEHLLLSLRVPSDKLDEGSGEVGATVDALTAYRLINERGGIVIAAHANSSHGVAMVGTDFGGQTRISYTQDENLHALEVTDLDSRSRRRTATFFSGSKSDYPRKMHCIQGSDAHKLVYDPKFKNEMGLGDRATDILLDEVSFDAIKQVFLGKDFTRTKPAHAAQVASVDTSDPFHALREQGNTLVQAFHERLKDKRGNERAVLEDIAAMANTNGGMVYVGASANAKNAIAGVERVESAMSELRNAIAKQITPALDMQIESLKSQNRNIIRIIVPRGTATPYTLDAAHIYIRADNKSRAATREEIVQLVRESLSVEYAATEKIPEAQQVEDAVAGILPDIIPATEIVPAIDPPHNGVEITATDIRKGTRFHSVRDLRNRRIVHNVTRQSARHLWQYAVDEAERNPVSESQVQWRGDIGYWKSYAHGGKMRYDLVQRANGKLFVYYGVTEDGLQGVWRDLVAAQTGQPIAAVIETPAVEATEEISTEPVEPEPAEIAPEEIEMPDAIRDILPQPEPEPAPEPIAPEPQIIEPEPPMAIEETPPPPASDAPRTRAQEWRELLDKAIEEARAAQEAARKKEQGGTDSNDSTP